MAMSGEQNDQEFPPAPTRWRRQGSESDVTWIIASRVVPFLLGLALIPIGFAADTLCTVDIPKRDCSGYNTRFTVGIIVEAMLFAAALVISSRSLRTTWATRGIVFASVVTFVAAGFFGRWRWLTSVSCPHRTAALALDNAGHFGHLVRGDTAPVWVHTAAMSLNVDRYSVLATFGGARYLGGHPSEQHHIGGLVVCLRAGGVDASNNGNTLMALNWSDVEYVGALPEVRLERRLTGTRLLLLGPIALFFPKRRPVSFLDVVDAEGRWTFALPGVSVAQLQQVISDVVPQ
jgi:hypothetical protein